ncbi:protein kinase domain-containing protein [Nocardiopsis algeriensis]|nr:phosphotransferase [Nocardiopsis algeriensis]
MDGRYLLFSPEGTVFYDIPDDGQGGRFSLKDFSEPSGWKRAFRHPWVSFFSPLPIPDQGWKIHVSSSEENAQKILSRVAAHCFSHDLSFKFLGSRQALRGQNAKYADRGSSGKFCTIYTRNEDELHSTLIELGDRLAGFPGPYILSDLRWGAGPLHVRYGGFRERYCVTSDGRRVPAIMSPNGDLVPDRREPAFLPPDWVEIPEFLEREFSKDEPDEQSFPFTPELALHFSNAGGVYQARDHRDNRTVVLKEARPYAGVDQRGEDAPWRLRREASVLERLSGLRGVPVFHGRFRAWEHDFLAMEYIDGVALKRAAMDRMPILVPGAPSESDGEYTKWALRVLSSVEEVVAQIHDRGVVIGDIHPKNVLLRNDDSPVFIDFEFSAVDDPHWRAPQGAPGSWLRPIFAELRLTGGCSPA